MPSGGLRFVTNLRPETAASFAPSGYRPAAWLLSSHRADATTLRLAAQVRAEGLDLVADNGTKPLIDDVVGHMEPRLAALSADIRAARRALPPGRRIPTARELPAGLADRAAAAADEVATAVDAALAADTWEGVLDRQIAMDPTHLVAREDFLAACLISLGLEREITRWPIERITRRNRMTLDMWEAVAADPRCAGRVVFATLGALDHATARAAARLAARRGARAVAVGFAGINLDTTYVESHVRGRRIRLDPAAPRRYVRTAAVLTGIRDGYRDEGRTLDHFHALGLGAAAMIPALASALGPETLVSADATSPLHDSVRDLVLYDEEAWGERVTIAAAAERVLRGEDTVFGSPFVVAARRDLGHRPAEARAWWEEAGRPRVDAAQLHPESPLGSALPVFANAGGSLTSRQTRTRTAHNHWVMDRLAEAVPASGRDAWARERMDALGAEGSVTIRRGVGAMRSMLLPPVAASAPGASDAG